MIHSNTCIFHGIRRSMVHAALILPAILLGILAMLHSGVSPLLWGQQLVVWWMFTLLAWLLQRVFRRIPADVLSALLLLPLTAVFLGDAVGGAKRWIDLGILSANAAFLVLPALLLVLHRARFPYPFLLGTASLLCLQPDLSQLTAFSLSSLPLLYKRREERFFTAASALLLAMLIIRCSYIPVTIDPVDYCEGIVTLLGHASHLLQCLGVIALAAIPFFWSIQALRCKHIQPLCLAVYYSVSLLFTLSGEYPVPFMGFGLSPIAGYFLAYVCMSDEH